MILLEGQRCPECHHPTLLVETDMESCDRCGFRLERWEVEEPAPYSAAYDAVQAGLPPSMTRWQEDLDPSLSGRLDE